MRSMSWNRRWLGAAILALLGCGSNGHAVSSVAYTARGAVTAGRGLFDVANVDNLMIDPDGGLWFGTDGNRSTNGTAEALYYLDLDPAHASSANRRWAFEFER